MSLLTLPDEIIYKIATCCVADHYFDAGFNGEFLNRPIHPSKFLCVNRGVLGLSLTNYRLRAICIPLLFASIGMQLDYDLESLDHLRRALQRRPHITEHIRSLALHDQIHRFDPEQDILMLNLFAQVLHLLPRLIEIRRLPSLSEDMIRAVYMYPTINTVYTFSHVLAGYKRVPLPADPHRLPDPLKKITISLVDYSMLMEDTVGITKSYLEQGMNIDLLEFLGEPDTRAMLDTLSFNRVENVTIFHHNLERSDVESLHEWLPSFFARLSGLSSVCFQRHAMHWHLLLFCGLEQPALRSGISDVATITSYRLEPATRQATEDTDAASDSWEGVWTVVSIKLKFKQQFPVDPSILSMFASSLSSITELDISLAQGESEPIAQAVYLIPAQLKAFRSFPRLRSLSIGTLFFPQRFMQQLVYDEENQALLTDLATGLFGVLPSVERIRMSMVLSMLWRPTGRLFRHFLVQQRPLGSGEGGSVERSVTPLYHEH